jgi:hypothetical protein
MFLALITSALLMVVTFGSPGTAEDRSTTALDISQAPTIDAALSLADYMPTFEQIDQTPEEVLDANQDLIHSVLELLNITDVAAPTGHAGTVVNPVTGRITLWWSGTVPTTVETVLQTAGLPGGFVIKSAPYSRYELIGKILESKHLWGHSALAMPEEDGSGVVLSYEPGTELDQEAIAASLGVPVTFTPDGVPVNTDGGRQNASSPWWGGAMMVRGDGNSACSTGFSVLRGTDGLVLSAAHCDTSGNRRWNNGNLENPTRLTPGDGHVSVILSLDSMLINPDPGGTAGRVHTGGIYSNDSKRVEGTATNNIGDMVATGGANSGEHRGLVIVDDAFDGTCNGYDCPTIVADAPAGENAAVGGDSGGPVYHTNPNGSNPDTLTAKGIIKAGFGSSRNACGPTRFDPGNDCFNRITYVPIRPILNNWNVVIEKG